MTSRDRVRACLTFTNPDRAPRDLWSLPGVEMFRRAELDQMLAQYPTDFAAPGFTYGMGARQKGVPNRVGSYTDEWGCVWSVAEDGVVGEVKVHPLEEWSALDSFRAPWEVLERSDWSQVDASCAASTRFVKGNSAVRLFERMQFLRGSENLFLDLAYLRADVYRLRDLVHEYYLSEIARWCDTAVDGVFFMDDWGSQGNLLIDPVLWRSFFKPMYKDYCDAIRGAGKFVFFHSDGNIEAIFPDLIDIGVHAVNSQLFCMDIEGLAARHKGHITFWGEICRQSVLPFGTPGDVHAAVRRVRHALDDGSGGVIAHCEWGNSDPAENIAAVFEAWDSPSNYEAL